jgi:hypothetical protein
VRGKYKKGNPDTIKIGTFVQPEREIPGRILGKGGEGPCRGKFPWIGESSFSQRL